MKKVRFISVAAFVVALVTLSVLDSCSKQDVARKDATGKQQIIMSTEDLIFQDNFVQFRDKVRYIHDNPSYKSGEVMDANEAIKQIESLFNATYGFPDKQYGKTKTNKTTVLIGMNDSEEVLLDDVVSTFDEIINIVTQFYYQCEFNQKGFLLLDLEKGETADGQVEIFLRSVIGEKESNWNPFGPDDYWWYGLYKGDCEWNNSGTDAAEKIEEAVNIYRPIVSPPPGYIFTYSAFEQVVLFGHEYESEIGEKLIFYKENESGTFTWEDKCLDPDEMNFHFYGEQEVIYTRLPIDLVKPSNWVFRVCNLLGKQEFNPTNGFPSIHHNNELTYALRHLAAIEIIGPPIEL
jgi:hypothetical protein